MNALVRRFIGNEQGATAIEYGLIAAFMGIGLIAAFGLFGTNLSEMFGWVRDRAGGAMDAAAGG